MPQSEHQTDQQLIQRIEAAGWQWEERWSQRCYRCSGREVEEIAEAAVRVWTAPRGIHASRTAETPSRERNWKIIQEWMDASRWRLTQITLGPQVPLSQGGGGTRALIATLRSPSGMLDLSQQEERTVMIPPECGFVYVKRPGGAVVTALDVLGQSLPCGTILQDLDVQVDGRLEVIAGDRDPVYLEPTGVWR